MWWYYFFPRGGPGDMLGIRGIANQMIKVGDLDKSVNFYKQLGLHVGERAGTLQTLRIGSWTEITLHTDDPTPSGATKLVFIMSEEDLQFAVKTLKEMGINFTTEPAELNDKIKIQRIRLKDPENQHDIELAAPKQNSR
jgi:catechol 2,3-dioxygenase-like lactoylglutathione lyase family enzyme